MDVFDFFLGPPLPLEFPFLFVSRVVGCFHAFAKLHEFHYRFGERIKVEFVHILLPMVGNAKENDLLELFRVEGGIYSPEWW